MKQAAISQIEERLIQLPVDEQLQLISRMAQRLRDHLNNPAHAEMPLEAMAADEDIQRELSQVKPDLAPPDPTNWGNKLARYREIVQSIMQLYASWFPHKADRLTEVVIDAERDHYVLMQVGWEAEHRVYHLVLHLDIINGKVWIQDDRTNRSVADALLEAGVPREDIVLGFHPPEVRQYTDFAAA